VGAPEGCNSMAMSWLGREKSLVGAGYLLGHFSFEVLMDLGNNPFTLRSLLIPTFKADFSTRVIKHCQNILMKYLLMSGFG